MVRRDEKKAESRSGKGDFSRRVSPAGVSPVPASVGAPGSRPQSGGREPSGRAGRQKGRRAEPVRGPQHQVKPAASTDRQSGGRAAHVTAKATLDAHVPKRASGTGGVEGAARAQGEARNSRDPSAWPVSGQGGAYKPWAKSHAAQRESEGVVVPKSAAKVVRTNAVQHNAAGGKDPCGGHVGEAGKREGMAGKTGLNYPRGPKPPATTAEPAECRGQAASREALPCAVRPHRAE